MRGGAID